MKNHPRLLISDFVFFSKYILLQVKLFIGFDYECPRGHRFFATSTGEPLILPKVNFRKLYIFQGDKFQTPASTRESMIKEAAEGLLDADLPLRRECTCRRKPLQVAQVEI